jgi:hypothetical protein
MTGQKPFEISLNLAHWSDATSGLAGQTMNQQEQAQALTWQEQDILSFFMDVSVGPNQMIDVQRLWQEWGARGTNVDFSDAIMGLMAKGLLNAHRDETAVALTEAGYAAASK